MYKFLLFIALYLPFQLALSPAGSIDLASIRVLILTLFFAWLGQGLKNKSVKVKNNLQTALILSFLFISSLSFFVAQNSGWSLRKLLFMFSIFPIYFVVSQIIGSQERMIKTAEVLVLSGSAVALIGIGQFALQFVIGLEEVYKFWANYAIMPFLGDSFSQAVLANPSWLVNIAGETYLRATATFPDPHMFSFYLGMLIPIAFAFLLSSTKKIIPAFLLGILFLADILTFSRGGYLGIFVSIVFLMAVIWNKIRRNIKIAAVAIFAIAIMAFIAPSPVSTRFYSIFNLQEGSNQSRIKIWKQALKIIKSNPLLGVGIGNYPLEIKPTASYREPIYAHNAYLDIAADSGIINLFIWIAIIGGSFWQFLKRRKESIFFLACGVSVLIFAIHSLVETGIYSPTVLALFLIIISFSNMPKKKYNSATNQSLAGKNA